MLEQACPILPSHSFEVSRKFYESWGFTAWYDDGNYLLMNRDKVELHFFHYAPIAPKTASTAPISGPQMSVRHLTCSQN